MACDSPGWQWSRHFSSSLDTIVIAPPSAGKSADTNCRDAPALWVSGAVSDVALLIHLILDSIIQDAGIEVRGPVRPRCVMASTEAAVRIQTEEESDRPE